MPEPRADESPLPPGAEKFPVTRELQEQIDRAFKARASLDEAKAMILLSAEASENEWPPLARVPAGKHLLEETLPAIVDSETALRMEICGAVRNGTPIPDAVEEAESVVRTTGRLLAVAGREMADGRAGRMDTE